MQLSDLVGRIRKTLGEVEPNGYGTQQAGQGTWDNSQIIGYLNEALGELAHDWRKETIATTTPTSVGQTDFTLPSDSLEDGLRKIIYVSNATTDPTQTLSYPMAATGIDHYLKVSAIPSTPTAYQYNRRVFTVFNGEIKIYPGVSQLTDSLALYYYRLPNTLANSADVPEIPVRFHQALIYYALRECQNAVEEVNLEFDAGQKWEVEKVRFRAEMGRNQRDRNRIRGRRS
jgi:hypothetical protein